MPEETPCWLSIIADTMEEAHENDGGDRSLPWLVDLLRTVAAAHQPLPLVFGGPAPRAGEENGGCDTCRDSDGGREAWPCREWWRAFHVALSWVTGRPA